MEEKRKEIEEKKLADCSFKPKINTSVSANRPKDQVFKHLYENHKEQPAVPTTEEINFHKIQDNCTFKPFMNKPAVSKSVNKQYFNQKNTDLMNNLRLRCEVARIVVI